MTRRPQSTPRLLLVAGVALYLALLLPRGALLAGGTGTIGLKPSSGVPGTEIRVDGSGFPAGQSIYIYWDGKQEVAKATAGDDGVFTVLFLAPEDAPGDHLVGACLVEGPDCDPGNATATFTLEGPPEPPSAPPETKAPTEPPATLPATEPPPPGPPPTAPGPTPTPGLEPPPIIDPPGDLPPVPWLVSGNGPCADIPFAMPYRMVDFERALTSSDRWTLSGERATPPMDARSGTTAWASTYDDFGSANRPITIDFGLATERAVALFVGRERPLSGSGDVLVVVSALGMSADSQVIELARATTVLEEAQISIGRCLHVAAPTGAFIRTVVVEYLDAHGDSSTERRWIDDLVVVGASPQFGLPPLPEPEVTITSPADGSTISQRASSTLRLIGHIRSFDERPPTANLRINRSGPLGGSIRVNIRRAPGNDPFLYEADATIGPNSLRDDAENEIEMIVLTEFSQRITRASTRFTLRVPIAGNIRVAEIEVNQAIQVPGNRVPLIGDKRTVVRVLVEGTADDRGPWGPVSARLITLAPDGISRTHAPLAPTNPATAPVSRYGPDGQLLFVLDRPETAAGRLHIEVQLQPVTPRVQVNIDDDVSRTTVTFVEPLRYTAYGVLFSFPTGETNDWSKLDLFSRFVENVFPVSSAQLVPVPGVGRTPQLVNDIGALRGVTGALLGRLPPDVSIFGLWPGSNWVQSLCNQSTGICESGFAMGRRTDGIGDPINWGAHTMAQELAHGEGLWWHAESPSHVAAAPFGFWNPFWPWPHSGIGHVGMDTRNPAAPMVIAPWRSINNHVHDFMGYAQGAWVSPYTYCVLLETFTRNQDRCAAGVRDMRSQQFLSGPPGRASTVALPSALAALAPLPVQVNDKEVEYLLVRGGIAWHADSATLDPIESAFRLTALPIGAHGDAFRLELVGETGEVLQAVPFTPPVTHHHEGEPVPFSLTVPRPSGLAEVRVMRGDKVLASREASATAPEVELSTSSSSLERLTEVSWAASDADGDELVYALEVSTDDKRSWLPIAAGLTEPSTMVDAASIAATGTGWLRVYASDGFHSTIADAGPFSVGNHPPSIALLSPPEGATVDQSTPVQLEVLASDVDEAALDGAAISWISGLDGALGEGRWLVVEDLTVGAHEITATATDVAGASATVSVRVTVRAAALVQASAPPGATAVPEPEASVTPSDATAQPELTPSASPAQSPVSSPPAPSDNNPNAFVLGLVALIVGSVLGALALAFFGRGNRRGGPPPESGD